MALADEPIAGGRHKVFGHPDLGDHPADVDDRLAPAARGRAGRRAAPRPPAGSRLRVAGGRRGGLLVRRRVGQSLHRGRRDQHRDQRRASEACRCRSCSSARTTAGASRCRRRRAGSSPRTDPAPGLDYLFADGADPADARSVIARGRRRVREQRRPVFLHLRTVRFLGHAGSDAEISYRTPREVEADYARDPLLATARQLRSRGCGPGTDRVRGTTQIRAEIDAEVDALRDQRPPAARPRR